jgi:hypothetical protein
MRAAMKDETVRISHPRGSGIPNACS